MPNRLSSIPSHFNPNPEFNLGLGTTKPAGHLLVASLLIGIWGVRFQAFRRAADESNLVIPTSNEIHQRRFTITITTMTSREFNQHGSQAKKAAQQDPSSSLIWADLPMCY